jgi:hypothetical protein
MLSCHCRRTGHIRYVLYANDSIKGQPLTRKQQLQVAELKLDETNRLQNKIELAVGMKTMVLMNLATNADLANGSRGIITDIILDPREPVQTKYVDK